MRRGAIPAQLLADIKNYVNVTWDDPDTDAKVSTLIAGGTVYLDGKYGEPADYEADGLPRSLLFDYVRYGLSEALDVFEHNFRATIMAMQNQRGVRVFENTAVPAWE